MLCKNCNNEFEGNTEICPDCKGIISEKPKWGNGTVIWFAIMIVLYGLSVLGGLLYLILHIVGAEIFTMDNSVIIANCINFFVATSMLILHIIIMAKKDLFIIFDIITALNAVSIFLMLIGAVYLVDYIDYFGGGSYLNIFYYIIFLAMIFYLFSMVVTLSIKDTYK